MTPFAFFGLGVPELIVIGGVGVVFLLLAVVVLKVVMGGKKPKGGRESSVEDLAEYPPPPPAGDRRLLLEGVPVRLRLVVVAPVGKSPIDLDEAREARVIEREAPID